jgi:RNA polymerase sigma-70 factor (ECF subfamily)
MQERSIPLEVLLTVRPVRCQRPRIPATLKSGDGGGVDPALLREVFALQPSLLAMARRVCRNEADARDLVQDVIEGALRSGERLAAVTNLRAWTITILHRKTIDLFRRRSHEVLTEVEVESPWIEPQLEDAPLWAKVTTEQLVAAVAQVEEPYRTTYRLFAFEKRSYKDIAAAQDIPIQTVGSRLSRARERLKELLLPSKMDLNQ